MSFRDEAGLLARELADLAVTGSSRELDSGGLAAALAGRHETLVLLRQVLTDVTGINRDDTGVVTTRDRGNPRRSIEELETHPVAVFSRALAAHPVPTWQGSHVDRTLTSAAEQGWRRVARHALLAGHDWSARPPRPTPKQQWSAVADVAALAQAVTVLDRDLAAVAQRLQDVDPCLVGALDASATSGLRVTAGEAGAMAASGPLPQWGSPGPDVAPTTLVLRVRSPQEVAVAQGRLSAQVADAEHLSPQAVALLARGQVRILSAAAVALRGVDDARSHRAGQLAQQLTASVTGSHRLAALMPDDLRPIMQTREVLQHLAAVGARGWADPSTRKYLPALAAAVDRSPAVVQALSRTAEQAVRTGKWIVPNTAASRAGEPLWRRATSADPEPRLCAALAATAAYATAFPPPPTTVREPVGAPPRETLTDIGSLARRGRPARPGHRPGQDVSRG